MIIVSPAAAALIPADISAKEQLAALIVADKHGFEKPNSEISKIANQIISYLPSLFI
jgi:hypothetical protein